MKVFKLLFSPCAALLLMASPAQAEFSLPFRQAPIPLETPESRLIQFGVSSGGGFQRATVNDRAIFEVKYNNPSQGTLGAGIYSAFGESVECILQFKNHFGSTKYESYGNSLLIWVDAGETFTWITDGTKAGTRLLLSSTTSPLDYFRDANVADFTVYQYGQSTRHDWIRVNDKLFMVKKDSDRFAASLTGIFDLRSHTYENFPEDKSKTLLYDTIRIHRYGAQRLIREFPNGQLGLVALGESGIALYFTDGTVAGTHEVIPNLLELQEDVTPYPADAKLTMFTAAESFGPLSTFVTDGTIQGTRRIPANLIVNGCGSTGNFIGTDQIGNKFVSVHCTPETGYEPWVLDLTTRSLSLLKDISSGSEGSSPEFGATSTAFGNTLIFTAADSEHGRELWGTDGTPEGTRLIVDTIPGPLGGAGVINSAITNYRNTSISSASAIESQPVRSEKQLIFKANDGSTWVTNGSPDGTYKVGASNEEFYRFKISPWVSPYFSPRFLGETAIIASEREGTNSISFFDTQTQREPQNYAVISSDSKESLAQKMYLAGVTNSHVYILIDTEADGWLRDEQVGSAKFPEGSWGNSIFLLVADRDQCPDDDRKVQPGVCGCGIEEYPARVSGDAVFLSTTPESQFVCLNSSAPLLFNPSTVEETTIASVSGSKTRAGIGRSLRLTLPKKFGVRESLRVAALSSGTPGKNKKIRFNPEHQYRLIRIDQSTGRTQLLRQTSTRKKVVEVRLGRNLKKNEKILLQYGFDLGAKKGRHRLLSSAMLQQKTAATGRLK